MIPESKLIDIIEDWREQHPHETNLALLARYITINTLRVLNEENAPESALLLASCVLLTSYIEKNRGIELLENGPGVVACFPIEDKETVTGVMCPNVAQALITMASRLYSE